MRLIFPNDALPYIRRRLPTFYDKTGTTSTDLTGKRNGSSAIIRTKTSLLTAFNNILKRFQTYKLHFDRRTYSLFSQKNTSKRKFSSRIKIAVAAVVENVGKFEKRKQQEIRKRK